MPRVTEADLKSDIKNSKFDKLYFLFGEEKYLIRHYSNKLTESILGKGYLDFNYQKFSSSGSTIDEIADAVEALPIMAEKKCVLVTDLDIEGMNATDQKKLGELISDIPDTTVLIISQVTLDINLKKSAKWKKFISGLEKSGTVISIDKMGSVAIERQLMSWAKKCGTILSQINAGKIVKLCGSDLLTLKNETEKLCAYVGQNEVTEQDIDLLITKNLETTVFVLSNALMSGDYNKAYKQLDLLFYQREEPVAILAVLASSYIDLYRARVAIESGENSKVLSEIFDYKNKEFRIKNAERDSRKMSTECIKESINIITETDLALKSSRTNSRILMEEMLSKLLVASRKER